MKLRTISGDYAELELTGAAAAHFADPNNYTAFILDEWETQPYQKYIKPGSVILDIGANIGLFALHVLPHANRIICVEPTPAHMVIQKELLHPPSGYLYLGSGFEIVNFHVEHEQSALNGYTGKAKFRNEPVNTTMNTLRDGSDSYEVDCITLYDLCKKYNLNTVDFCKIDIEGSEWQALTVERIAEVKGVIKAFFVELHPRSIESQNEMKARFEQAGYNVELIDYNGSIYCYE